MKTTKSIKKLLAVVLAMTVLAVGAVILWQATETCGLRPAPVGMGETTEELYANSDLIAVAEPTGKVRSFRWSGLDCRLAEVRLIGAVRGEAEQGAVMQIFQVEGELTDVPLEKDQRYLLFLYPYGSGPGEGARKAKGAWVTRGAYRGIYLLDIEGNLGALGGPGESEEARAARQSEMKAIIDSLRLR